MNKAIKAIKETLAYPNNEMSLFDCMELNERTAEQGKVARAAIRNWRAIRQQHTVLNDCVAKFRYGRYCMTARRLAEQEVKSYLEMRGAAKMFQNWYIQTTTPSAYQGAA